MVCAVASLLFIIAGGAIAGVAAARLKHHQARTQEAAERLVDAKRVHAIVARLSAADVALAQLLDRAKAAVASIGASLEDLRLPQAMLALRAAGAAVRLLFSGR